MKPLSLALILSLSPLNLIAQEAGSRFPILEVPRSAGASALLQYELTPQETELFKEIDVLGAVLADDSDLSAYHDLAIRIGARHGLTPGESIAFFTRTVFSEFEP